MTFGAPCGGFTSKRGGALALRASSCGLPRIVRLGDRQHRAIDPALSVCRRSRLRRRRGIARGHCDEQRDTESDTNALIFSSCPSLDLHDHDFGLPQISLRQLHVRQFPCVASLAQIVPLGGDRRGVALNLRTAMRFIHAPLCGLSPRLHQAESEMVRRSTDIALTAGANHVARAVLIGAQKGAAAMDAFHHAGFVRVERG